MYQVIGRDGQVYGPVDVNTLKQWAADRRLEPQTMMIDPISGRTQPAEQMLADLEVFPTTPPAPGELPVFHAVVPVPSASAPLAAHAGPMRAASLGTRVIALFIDFACAVPLLFVAWVPFLGGALLCSYWLFRDAFFGGQSLGKRAMGLRVVRLDGQPFGPGNSVIRNIAYLTHLVTLVPIIGLVLFVPAALATNIIEVLLVATTGKRIGDHLGRTMVIAAP